VIPVELPARLAKNFFDASETSGVRRYGRRMALQDDAPSFLVYLAGDAEGPCSIELSCSGAPDYSKPEQVSQGFAWTDVLARLSREQIVEEEPPRLSVDCGQTNAGEKLEIAVGTRPEYAGNGLEEPSLELTLDVRDSLGRREHCSQR
jgi:hypothetical protein